MSASACVDDPDPHPGGGRDKSSSIGLTRRRGSGRSSHDHASRTSTLPLELAPAFRPQRPLSKRSLHRDHHPRSSSLICSGLRSFICRLKIISSFNQPSHIRSAWLLFLIDIHRCIAPLFDRKCSFPLSHPPWEKPAACFFKRRLSLRMSWASGSLQG